MKPILIIDPGHGGNDPGGGSNKHWKEKDFNLDISLYQYQRFNDLGIKTVLTRDKDITIGPTERAKIVRESGATYCISNHINAGGGEGAETIHSIYSKPTLARTILDEIVKSGQKERRVFVRTLPNNPKRDYYFMHRETGTVDTTIIEYGFADNANDTERLLANWNKYAESVVLAFCLHIGHPYIPLATKNTHWAEPYYNSLLKKGVNISEKRFDDPVTRGEIFALLDRIVK